jgi:hypothetical protein
MRPHISDDARTLLRAAGDILREEGRGVRQRPGTGSPFTLDMPAASERAGMPIGSVRYMDAMWELEQEGIIMRNPLGRHMGRGTEYILTPRGLEVLGLKPR